MDQRPSGDRAEWLTTATGRPSRDGNGVQGFFRLDLARSLRRHRGLVLSISLAGVALRVVYWFWLGPVYEAQSLV